MQLLKNKHLILAMFVSPVLAVIAYFAVDSFVSEKPHVAVQGGSYKLVAKSNCRYKSGICTLQNGGVEVKVRVEALGENKTMVLLSSEVPVQNAIVSLVDKAGNGDPVQMIHNTEKLNVWSASLNKMTSNEDILRLALNISGTHYYAEATTVFVDYETSFSRDNFTN